MRRAFLWLALLPIANLCPFVNPALTFAGPADSSHSNVADSHRLGSATVIPRIPFVTLNCSTLEVLQHLRALQDAVGGGEVDPRYRDPSARRAVQFFAERDAVPFILRGLRTRDLASQRVAAEYLAFVDPEKLVADKALVLSVGVKFLEDQQFRLMEGEIAGAQQMIRGMVIQGLAQTMKLPPQYPDRDAYIGAKWQEAEVLKQGRRWLTQYWAN